MAALIAAAQLAERAQAALPRRTLALPAGVFGVFICLISGLVMLRPAIDFDLSWHVRTGHFILATHTIPRGDLYSFTFQGAPWVEHEWLWQVVMALLDSAGGRLAIVFFGSALITLAMALAYLRLRARQVSALFAALGPAGAMATLAHYTEIRPAMVITVLTAVYLFAFERFERGQNWRWLAGVIPLQVVWANCHGSYLIGLLLCGVYGAGALWDERRWLAVKPWATLFTGLVAASAANPTGLQLFRFTLFASRLRFNREFIAEWKAPDFADPFSAPLLISIALSIFLAFVWRGAPRRRRDVLLLSSCTLLALLSQQFGLLYAVAAVPLVVHMLYDACGRPVARAMQAPSAMVLALTVLGMAFAGPMRTLQASAYDARLAELYPSQAVAFIERAQLQGPMLNELDWGAWLIGALPRLPLFVDGRTEIYGDSFLYRYQAVADGLAPADPLLDRYGINLALIRSTSALATELRQERGWRELYSDKLASVFVRSGS